MKYDVLIIGGGPAGIMSSISAAQNGLKVALIEKNSKLGIKFLSTGGGRSNLTNLRDDRDFVKAFAHSGSWLFSALSQFNSYNFVDFLNKNGIATKIEDDSRVFPEDDMASSVLDFFLRHLDELGVDVFLSSEFLNFIITEKIIDGIMLKNGKKILSDKVVIASGGRSYPITGSNGSMYDHIKSLGHQVSDLRPALVPLRVSDNVSFLEGLSLRDVCVKLFDLGKKIADVKGDCIFTKDSLSGPAILNLSNNLSNSDFTNTKLIIDLLPDINTDELDKRMQDDFKGNNKSVKNYLQLFTSSKLISFILSRLSVDGEKKVSVLSKKERFDIVNTLKSFDFKILSLGSFERAMVTSGGVNLKEVDPKTMKSKIIDNLYFAGEVLDLHAISGGYNLQLCWTTGYVAGKSCY